MIIPANLHQNWFFEKGLSRFRRSVGFFGSRRANEIAEIWWMAAGCLQKERAEVQEDLTSIETDPSCRVLRQTVEPQLFAPIRCVHLRTLIVHVIAGYMHVCVRTCARGHMHTCMRACVNA